MHLCEVLLHYSVIYHEVEPKFCIFRAIPHRRIQTMFQINNYMLSFATLHSLFTKGGSIPISSHVLRYFWGGSSFFWFLSLWSFVTVPLFIFCSQILIRKAFSLLHSWRNFFISLFLVIKAYIRAFCSDSLICFFFKRSFKSLRDS